MVSTDLSDARHAALASEPRRRVLGLLTAADTPLDAVTVAAGIGLHVTTARFHLEQLEAAGLVERQVARAGQRGRPHVLFSAAATPLPADDAQQQLTQALAAVIGEDADGGRARSERAGERWSAQYAAVADAGADIVDPLLRVLTEIGFEPELRAEDNTIALPTCPFRAEARANPDVVCSVHLGLIKGLVRERGYDASGIRLEPFVQPTLCLVHLPATPAN
jgi:predicted ArsR family transcriptional regulator